MQNQIGAPKQKLSFSDPKVRAWLFQIITIVAVVSLGWYLFDNTQTNLQHRGITSGFDFLERSAGFGIAQHLIDYTESDSYARVFVIGLLNTLLVTVIGVVLATLLGFIIGVARLSPNWMINKLATVYVEVFRNIPPLLQILFWYFAVFLTMPGPRNSHNFGDTFFVSSRGLNMPAALAADGFWPFVASVVVASVVALVDLRVSEVARGPRAGGYQEQRDREGQDPRRRQARLASSRQRLIRQGHHAAAPEEAHLASKSSRNLVRKPSMGQAAASPSGQMVLPAMP